MRPRTRSARESSGRRPTRHLSYANVASTLALVVAVTGGGAAYAAATIHTKDIANGAVTAAKLHDGAVTAGKRATTPQAEVQFDPANPGVPVPANTSTTVSFNVQAYDRGTMWSPTAPERLTIRQPGSYLVVGTGVWQSGQPAGSERNLCVILQSAEHAYKDAACQRMVPNTSWTQTERATLVTRMAKGDSLLLQAYQDGPAGNDLLDPRLVAVWLGP